jgi:AcrR family transcriptional regulator
MTSAPAPRLAVMEASTRDRIVAAAVEITTSSGWAAVTMARLAEAAGVSRQTVYNEVGSKPALAESMILDELARFLRAVEQAFDAEPDDLTRAIERAVSDVLTYASANKLLHAVVSATHGADTELLPLLTTNAAGLLGVAKEVIGLRVAPYQPSIDADHLGPAIDMVVRVVLSHVMQPSDSPEKTGADIAWLSGQVLGPQRS